MKKIIISVLALAFLFVAAGVMAKEEKYELRKQAPEAKEIKIHKKQLISDEERKALDEAAKGRPADKAAKVKVPLSWATGVLGNPLPVGGERYAIVVGLANYTGVVNDLCAPEAETYLDNPEDGLAYYCQDRDAYNMKTALINEYNFTNVTHLRDYQATRAGITGAMNTLANNPNLDEKDEVVFFFSGHGTSGKLISPQDKETIDEAIFVYDNNYIWDDELKNWANNLGVNRAVFIFDICLAGGMNDIAGINRVIAMSSGETQSSWTYTLGGGTIIDEDGIAHTTFSEGLFSHHFVVDGITNGLADKSNLISQPDYQVAVEEAFSYTYPIVKYKQTPVISDKFTNDLILNY